MTSNDWVHTKPKTNRRGKRKAILDQLAMRFTRGQLVKLHISWFNFTN